MEQDNIITLNLKRIHLIILIFIGIATMATPAITAFLSIGNNANNIRNNTFEIGKIDGRVKALEQESLSNHDLLLEMKFNLKNYMGNKYIDLDVATKKLQIK